MHKFQNWTFICTTYNINSKIKKPENWKGCCFHQVILEIPDSRNLWKAKPSAVNRPSKVLYTPEFKD